MRDYVDSLAAEAESQCPTCQQPLSVDLSAVSSDAARVYGGGTANSGGEGAAAGEGAAGCAAAGGVAAAGRSKRGILARLELSKFQSSTKIEALMEELYEMRAADPSAKALIFSQFVSFLDLMEHRLLSAGVRVVKLNGGMTPAAREATLRAFNQEVEGTAEITIDIVSRRILLSISATLTYDGGHSLHIGGGGGDPDLAQGGRCRAQPDGRLADLPDGPLVEPCRRVPSD